MASRDDTFFFDDGSIQLRVCDTLFKVHQSRLGQLSPGLDALLDSHDMRPGPIVLDGVSPAQLKAFLWSIYASPEDVEDFLDATPSPAKCMRLINIAAVGQIYGCSRRAAWALRHLYANWTKSLTESPGVPAYLVQGLLSVHGVHAQLPSHIHASLLRALELRHLGVIGGVLYSINITSVPADLTGAAFYAALLLGAETWDTSLVLSAEHRHALYRGFHDLSAHWRAMEQCPPPVEHCCPASDEQRCERAWRRCWARCVASDPVRELDPADVLGRLKAAREVLPGANEGRVKIAGHTLVMSGGGHGVHAACVPRALLAVDHADQFVRGMLADFFRPTSEREYGASPLTPSSSRTIASSRTMNALVLRLPERGVPN